MKFSFSAKTYQSFLSFFMYFNSRYFLESFFTYHTYFLLHLNIQSWFYMFCYSFYSKKKLYKSKIEVLQKLKQKRFHLNPHMSYQLKCLKNVQKKEWCKILLWYYFEILPCNAMTSLMKQKRKCILNPFWSGTISQIIPSKVIQMQPLI